MNHEEVQELLGAFALDAVEDEEAEAVELHLMECPRCRAEVASHREVAALLGNGGLEAPHELWNRISAGLEGESAPPALTGFARPSDARREPGGWSAKPRRGAVALAVAAAVAALALVGVKVSSLDGKVNHLQSALAASQLSQAAAEALFSQGAHQVVLASDDDHLRVDVAVRSDGQAVVVWDDLPALKGGRTYQLWGLVGHSPVSLGLTGSDARNATFRLDSRVSLVMVTAEPAGGVTEPGSAPVLVQGSVSGLF
jgi:anti-sigma factor RsiW